MDKLNKNTWRRNPNAFGETQPQINTGNTDVNSTPNNKR